jgi:predicted RNA-binding protein Jag
MQQNEFIIETVGTLLKYLGVVVTSITEEIDEKTTSHRFMVITPENSILIGEGGTRLLALNHLIKRVVEKKFGPDATTFMIDVNGYQKKQVDEIRTKAHMLAERARYFKSTVEMDPMSSYERMIVHSEFADSPDIATESAGMGRDRHILLKYTESKVASVL